MCPLPFHLASACQIFRCQTRAKLNQETNLRRSWPQNNMALRQKSIMQTGAMSAMGRRWLLKSVTVLSLSLHSERSFYTSHCPWMSYTLWHGKQVRSKQTGRRRNKDYEIRSVHQQTLLKRLGCWDGKVICTFTKETNCRTSWSGSMNKRGPS